MNPEHKDFYDLAQKLKRLLVDGNRSQREVLEATLLPMVRCAIRSGHGQPLLVNWVKRQLGSGQTDPAPQVDPMSAAVPLARAFSEIMWSLMDPLSGRETIVGF